MSFEEALDLTVKECSRYTWMLFTLCSIILIGISFEIFSVFYLVPASSCELGTSSGVQELLMYIPLISAVSTCYLWGYLGDTMGRRKILIISLAITYIAGTAAAFSPHWIVFSLFKFVSSASAFGSFALTVILLSECTSKVQRNTMVLLTTSAYMAGIGLLAVVTMLILPMKNSYFYSWRVLDLIAAVPCALSAIGCYFVYESPKYLVTVNKEKEAIEVLKGMFVMNTGKSADNYEVNSLELDVEEKALSLQKGFWDSIVTQTVPIVKPPLLKHTLLLALLFVINFNTMNAFIAWMPFIANAFVASIMNGQKALTICEIVRFSANTTATEEIDDCSVKSFDMSLLAVFVITMIIAIRNAIAGKMINTIMRKRLFLLVQVEAGLSGLMINFNPGIMSVAIMFMVAMSGIFNFGTLISYIIDIFPTSMRAKALCLVPMVGLGSAVIGINHFKILLDTNCEAAFYIYGTLSFGGLLVRLLLPKDEKEKQN